MVQSEYRRLQRIVVQGLFHTYDHDIPLNLDDRVTLLHGPNGVGKTVILGMTNALLKERLYYFRRIPFARFTLQFHDGGLPQNLWAEWRTGCPLVRPPASACAHRRQGASLRSAPAARG